MKSIITLSFLATMVAVVAFWIGITPGAIRIDWLGYRIDTNVLFVFVCLFIFLWVWGSIRYIGRLFFGIILRPFKENKTHEMGLLWQGLRELEMGEIQDAHTHLHKFYNKGNKTPLALWMLLKVEREKGIENKTDIEQLRINPIDRPLALKFLAEAAVIKQKLSLAIDYMTQGVLDTRYPHIFLTMLTTTYKHNDLYAAAWDFYMAHKDRLQSMRGTKHTESLATLITLAALAKKEQGNNQEAANLLSESLSCTLTYPALRLLAQVNPNHKAIEKEAKKILHNQKDLPWAWTMVTLIQTNAITLPDRLKNDIWIEIATAIHQGFIDKVKVLTNNLPEDKAKAQCLSIITNLSWVAKGDVKGYMNADI